MENNKLTIIDFMVGTDRTPMDPITIDEENDFFDSIDLSNEVSVEDLKRKEWENIACKKQIEKINQSLLELVDAINISERNTNVNKSFSAKAMRSNALTTYINYLANYSDALREGGIEGAEKYIGKLNK